jgi:folate-binding protein YgfZ
MTTGLSADRAQQYEAVRRAGGFYRSAQRGLIEARGKDRGGWLHNLTTNVVRTLQPGDGNYAFAINVQGRTLFDLNIIAQEDCAWLDVDHRWVAAALVHLNKYIIVEDVKLKDISSEWVRFVVLGPASGRVVAALGLPANFDVFANLQHARGAVQGTAVEAVKNNLGPVRRAELWVAADGAAQFEDALAAAARAHGAMPIAEEVAEIIRIEVGQPASIADIDDQVIPPETLQVERGISYVKGCYLGQEIIERMRSRGSMARRLVGLRVASEHLPPHNAPIFADAKEVGRATSACHSPALGGVLALGYVKTLLIDPKVALRVAIDEQTAVPVEVVELPLPAWRAPAAASIPSA